MQKQIFFFDAYLTTILKTVRFRSRGVIPHLTLRAEKSEICSILLWATV